MEEENKNAKPEEGGVDSPLLAGKFKSVDALLHAYGELEAEFTRRSQRLKALEEQAADAADGARNPHGQEELRRAAADEEGERGHAEGESLQVLRGVPLMTGGGIGITAPAVRPKTIAEAGSLALGYLRNQKS